MDISSIKFQLSENTDDFWCIDGAADSIVTVNMSSIYSEVVRQVLMEIAMMRAANISGAIAACQTRQMLLYQPPTPALYSGLGTAQLPVCQNRAWRL